MRRSRKIFIAALAAIIVVALLGSAVSCGNASPDRGSSSHVKEPSSGSDSATCKDGDVFLGSRSGIIGFSAHCRSQGSGGVVTLDLFRLDARKSKSAGILGFSQHLSVMAPWVQKHGGFCDLRQAVLGCRVRIARSVKVSGRIRVRKGRECSKRIILEVIEKPQCNEGCLAVARARVLARRRPRGC
jgi:hypothetical protein